MRFLFCKMKGPFPALSFLDSGHRREEEGAHYGSGGRVQVMI